ncbi:MAG TPA: choice-of-anchor tandem repeat GloVer-containing protein [Terriglobia bacterium]|jgi:uncharacterized repeat protein (TIGR03803 family)|nr:choice-of-anchor tandem repeat GloVer-containing protein [Terriglobia bacterium]
MRKIGWWKTACAVCVLCAVTAIASPAQTFTTLHSFDGTDGDTPYAGLVQATDGNLYGTTAAESGTVFRITPGGTLTTLYSFCSQGQNCADGSSPNAGLVQASDGDFYGTTFQDGANGAGTVFKITASGMLTTLYSFCSENSCPDGSSPTAALVQGINGNLYGTTVYGGAAGGGGTVFKITPSGLATLYSFCPQGGANCPGGANPVAGLVQATDGNLYGTTSDGGAKNYGTVFKITPSGALTTLYSFCSQSGCADGANPNAGLVQATNGNFYGTTYGGGVDGNGTVFQITPSGTLTTLYTFCSQSGCADGADPYRAALVQAADGSFYGTTANGGANGGGTVFRITSSGTLRTLYSFCARSSCTDGEYPYAALVQDTNGNLYGTTSSGGANGRGTVFSISVGLGPFVETQPTSTKVGAGVRILGTNLTGATRVTFNGTLALFDVVSSSFITTTVPAGAATGKVQVVTPGGTLTSNVVFRVLP